MSVNYLENQELAKKELIGYGFGNQESERICLEFRNPNERDYANAIRENNSFLEKLGFSKEEVIRFAKKLYSFYDLDKDYIQAKIDEIVSLGISKEEAINLCKTTSIFGTKGSSREHMQDVVSLGYSKDDALDMLKEDYEMYLNLGVSKNQWFDLFNKLSQLGFEKRELLEMLKKYEINYLHIHEYESAFGNIEIAKNAIDKLLAQGLTKSEALNEYRKLYLSIRQEEAQRRFDESQEPVKGMSR